MDSVKPVLPPSHGPGPRDGAALLSEPATEARPPYASPAVRRLARDFGVDLGLVSGTGPHGRILQEDVRAFIRSELTRPRTEAPAPAAASAPGMPGGLLPWPVVDFAKFGPVETSKLSRLKTISGANLARNWITIPHVTNFDEADVTDLDAFRVSANATVRQDGVELSMLAFLVKVMAETLKRFPEFNASLVGTDLILKRYFHIGFAVDTPAGLLVPIIRDADRKGVSEIAREAADLAAKAREGKLGLSDMHGGSISISWLGQIGGIGFTPIINAPEVAILGVARTATRPRWNGREFLPRLILPVSLSWDHRAVDGVAAGRFLVHFADLLGDPRRLLL